LGDRFYMGASSQDCSRHKSQRLSAGIHSKLPGTNYAFTRLELVDKDELFPAAPVHPAYRIGAYTLGGERDLGHEHAWQLGLGADVTFYSEPAALHAAYGNRPVSFQIFLRLRPGNDQKGHNH
jgi:hypothetical protein